MVSDGLMTPFRLHSILLKSSFPKQCGHRDEGFFFGRDSKAAA